MRRNPWRNTSGELIRTLRGRRTQGQVSRKLGYKANQVYRWEAGVQAVGWKEFVAFCRICGVDLRAACVELLKFEGNPARSRELARHFLGGLKVSKFARQTGVSRFKVARWLNGRSDFTLDEVLELIERTQNGLFDFVFHLTRGAGIPRFKAESATKRRYAELLKVHPWISVLRVCLDLAEYKRLPRHAKGFISAKTGIPVEREDDFIAQAVAAGALRWEDGKLRINNLGTNVRGDHAVESARVRYWAEQAAEVFRVHGERSKSRFQLVIYSASDAAVARIREETLDFYTKLRAILAADGSETDRIQVLGLQLLDMDDFGDLSRGEG